MEEGSGSTGAAISCCRVRTVGQVLSAAAAARTGRGCRGHFIPLYRLRSPGAGQAFQRNLTRRGKREHGNTATRQTLDPPVKTGSLCISRCPRPRPSSSPHSALCTGWFWSRITRIPLAVPCSFLLFLYSLSHASRCFTRFLQGLAALRWWPDLFMSWHRSVRAR